MDNGAAAKVEASQSAPAADEGDDDIEALASKACALASIPVPDYADAFRREEESRQRRKSSRKGKSKSRSDFTIDDEDEPEEAGKDEKDSIALAEKTASILSNFQDYVSGIGGTNESAAAKEILFKGGGGRTAAADSASVLSGSSSDNLTSILAGNIRSETKDPDTILRRKRTNGADGGLNREWNYEGYHSNKPDTSVNLNFHSGDGNMEIWEDTEQANLSRGQKYTHPFRHSKRIKCGVINLVIVAVIVLSATLGTSKRRGKGDAGTEFTSKVEDLEKELDEGSVTLTSIPKDHPLHQAAISDDQLIMYEKIFDTYNPREFDRDNGWKGRTYKEAVGFCQNLDGYELCPSIAICPLGSDSAPITGFKAAGDDVGAYAPISDSDNDWVNLSEFNSCIKYSAENPSPPEWGVLGVAEAITRNVVCCHGNAHSPNKADAMTDESMQVYIATADKYKPLEFDRNMGWKGRTYIEALEFCGSLDDYEICPYDAICPKGIDSEPFSGYKVTQGEQWMPILDTANDWVKISTEGSCSRYSSNNSQPPSWSITGSGDDAITQYISCCLFDTAAESSSEAETIMQATTDPIVMAYEASLAKYSTIYYSRDNGECMKSFYARRFCTSNVEYS